jgi:photosystem II stability/assembly factor-like uncharacterized protein
MKFKSLIIPVVAMFVLGFSITTMMNSGADMEKKYVPREEMTLQQKGIDGAVEWLNVRRGDPVTGYVNPESREKAYKNYLAFRGQSQKSTLSTTWDEMGPNNVGGRTRAILVDKNNYNIMYAGAVSGGLWKSTTAGSSWSRVPGMEEMIIGSICQAANGDIYVGTGEGYTADDQKGSGFWGRGIFKSTDGVTFTQIPSTWDGTTTTTNAFKSVYSLAAHPTNPLKIYAGTHRGLRVSTDGGTTWTNPITSTDASGRATCVKISKDATVVVAAVNDKAYICNTGDDVFLKKSGSTEGTIPTSTTRIELDIAPSNPNYIYCQVATISGSFKDIYQSKDKGETFFPVINSTHADAQIFGSNNQGWYDNVISVYPNDPESFLAGGIDIHLWKENTIILERITAWYLSEISPMYVHADIHTIVFHPNYVSPTNPNGNTTIYVGCDGGIFRSINGGGTWTNLNKNYITTQFYSVAYSGDGRVMGGTQDNGTLYIDLLGTSPKNSKEFSGGDGGYCEFSMLNPGVMFSTVYYGQLSRSEDRGVTRTISPAEVYDDTLTSVHNIGSNGGAFVTPIRLWETYFDPASENYIEFKAPKAYVLGELVYIQSKSKRFIRHFISQADLDAAGGSIEKDDTITVQDHYSSMLAVGLNGRVWMTREGVDFSKVPPKWNPIAVVSGMGSVQTMEFSACGSYLYYSNGTSVYRTGNLHDARTNAQSNATKPTCVLTTQNLGSFGSYVTALAVDPQNPNNLVVVTGTYDAGNHIYYSNNAATTTSSTMTSNFTVKQGNLPDFPVYSAVINWEDSRQVVIGTEFGIFATDDITAAAPQWSEENNGIEPVPVFMLRQQRMVNGWSAPAHSPTDIYNHGVIYAGTHGRGIYRCETFMGPVGIQEAYADKVRTVVSVYPNPVTDYAVFSCNVLKMSDVTITVYDMRGNVIINETHKNVAAGEMKYTIDRANLKTGTYLYSVNVGGDKANGKFIIQ